MSIQIFLFLSILVMTYTFNLQSQNVLSEITNTLPGASMGLLSIQAGEQDNAEFRFGCPSNFYSFTYRGQFNDFIISNVQRPIISINQQKDLMIFSSTVNAEKEVKFTGQFKVRGIPQWKLVYDDDFSKPVIGWSNSTTSECGGITMLGGYCNFGGGEVTKTFENLPEHTSVRIQATYHFIDAWDTETGFMRINNGKDGEMQYAWIDRYSAFSGNNGIDVCGGRWPEGKFASPIDVSIPHKDKSVKIGFGSTIEQDPCDESFGISGIKIYIK
jgi:hypothetical protein